MGSKTEIVATPGGVSGPFAADLTNLLTYFLTGKAGTATSGPQAADYEAAIAKLPAFLQAGARKTYAGAIAGLPGPTPVDRTSMIARGIESLLTPTNLAPTGEALQSIIQKQRTTDVANLRARFGASGGTAFGTPGAVGEARYRAEAAPREALALGELGLRGAALDAQRLQPIFQLLGLLLGRGVPQATENVFIQPSDFTSFLTALSGAGQAGANIYGATAGA